jgi:hypothetical protein
VAGSAYRRDVRFCFPKTVAELAPKRYPPKKPKGNKAVKCPHCLQAIHANFRENQLLTGTSQGETKGFSIFCMACPECDEAIINLESGAVVSEGTNTWDFQMGTSAITPVYPSSATRNCPAEVPIPMRDYFLQATAILDTSPMASAALSRRCIQMLLHDHAGAQQRNLSDQIDHVLNQKAIPTTLGEQLQAVREVGNFAAHPMKNTQTGEIIEVELHEAAWNLDVLEELFDFYLVAPARAKAKVAALNLKLQQANRKPV